MVDKSIYQPTYNWGTPPCMIYYFDIFCFGLPRISPASPSDLGVRGPGRVASGAAAGVPPGDFGVVVDTLW